MQQPGLELQILVKLASFVIKRALLERTGLQM